VLRSSAFLAEYPKGFNQDHLNVYLCGEACTLPPTDQPDFILRRYEGLRICLPVHEAEERMAEWDVLLSMGGL